MKLQRQQPSVACPAQQHRCPARPQAAVPSPIAAPQAQSPGPLLDLGLPAMTVGSLPPKAARGSVPASAEPDGLASRSGRSARRDGGAGPDTARWSTWMPRSRPPAGPTVATRGQPYGAWCRFPPCRYSDRASAEPQRERFGHPPSRR